MNPSITSSTGFAANIDNFNVTSKDFDFYDGTGKNMSGFDLVKSDFFVIPDQAIDNLHR
jgi:hypothetical protein